LSRQDQSDEKLQWITEVEIELGVRMSLFEAINDFFDSLLGSG